MNIRPYGAYIQLGLQLGVSMTIPVLAGLWLDNRYGTGPWLLVAGAALGFISVFWSIIKVSYELDELDRIEKLRKKNEHKRTKETEPGSETH
ncbi:MAG: AtpZ/AtpI family protein [Balneolales bacterium]|nr:AtpZ/AtpI family protein [Balneolales bacterium]